MRRISLLIMVATALVACSSADADRVVTTAGGGVKPPDPAGIAVVQTSVGLAGVDQVTHQVRWRREVFAVAAIDGSAIFEEWQGNVVRFDPRTGDRITMWPVTDDGLAIALVAPDGRWVVRTDKTAEWPYESPTHVVVHDGSTGEVLHDLSLIGRVEPEAFSPDGSMLFSLTHRDGTYRVQTIVLATGLQIDTSSSNKEDPVEDMKGERIRGVLSSTGTHLSTLYRNPGNRDEPAFVHVLDLEGFTYCVDLPAPFGAGNDSIQRTADDQIIVLAHDFGKRASFGLRQLINAGDHNVLLTITDGPMARADAAYQDVPGFESLVGELEAEQ